MAYAFREGMVAQPVAHHPAESRGSTETDWLTSRHSFSFGDWHDPQRMGIPPLRVLNHDRVAPGAGFGSHPHRDMEILSYVLEGAMEHEDDGGHSGIVREGEVQFMRAGRGVVHSEMNASDADPLAFLQVWFEPRNRNMDPLYQKADPRVGDHGTWALLARDHRRDPDDLQARGDGLPVDCDVVTVATRLAEQDRGFYELDRLRQAYLYVVEGGVTVDDTKLGGGDAVLLRGDEVIVDARSASHLVLFDLPEGG